MRLSLLLPLLVLFHIQSVDSCIRFFDDCCSDYIPHQLPENTRFDDPDILYMTPKMTKNSDCSKVTVDCTFSGMPSDTYNLVFTDNSDKVTKVIESSNPVFELDCNTGTENYISCELGCDSEKCPKSDKVCASCDIQSLFSTETEENRFVATSNTQVMNGDGCVENEVECFYDKKDCVLSIIGVDEESNSLQIAQARGTNIKGTVSCGANGKYESEGKSLTSLHCTYGSCYEVCQKCVARSLIKSTSDELSFIVIAYPQACYSYAFMCSLKNNSICTFKMFVVTENSESILLAEATSARSVKGGTVNCDDDGKLEYNGQILASLYCTYEDCQ